METHFCTEEHTDGHLHQEKQNKTDRGSVNEKEDGSPKIYQAHPDNLQQRAMAADGETCERDRCRLYFHGPHPPNRGQIGPNWYD